MIQRVRGTRDFTPPEMSKRRQVEDLLRKISLEYGYREIQTPVLENAELFIAKSGPGILEEMYSFQDKGGRQLSLRPELTAPIIRFYINDLSNYPLPLKVFCVSNCFRYEEPQSGRYREFYQYDVEIIGSDAPEADAELLMLAYDLCSRLGLTQVMFRIGHVGIIRSLLDKAGLTKEDQASFLRLVDKKKLEDAGALLKEKKVGRQQAETILGTCQKKGGITALEGIEGQSASYLREVIRVAEAGGARNLNIDLGVVRGLDYYTGLVFEIDALELGAEKQICGGGSYSLAQLFGGQETPSTGMAFGFDRLILAMEKAGTSRGEDTIDVFVLAVSDNDRESMIKLAGELRRNGIAAEFDLMKRSMSKALKYASGRGAKLAAILGEKERREGVALLRNMTTGEQTAVKLGSIVAEVRSRLDGRGV